MIPTEQQRAVFDWFARGRGHLIVRARAGTGKTTTILEAVKYARERRILLCAFNKRMTEELKLKLQSPNAQVRTLHSLGFSILRRAWPEVVVDEDRGLDLARQAFLEVLRPADWPAEKEPLPFPEDQDAAVQAVAKLAGVAKNVLPMATAQQLEELTYRFDQIDVGALAPLDEAVLSVAAYRALQLAKERTGRIDFDDMVFLPLVYNLPRPWYDMVVVDEAQDMNATQLNLAQRVTRGRIVVVGDDRQALYGFRGADTNALDRLKRALRAVELPLTTSFRCPVSVVQEAAKLVPDFTAAAGAKPGEVMEITEDDMLGWIRARDFLLSRTNAPLAKFCLQLIRAGKPARIEGRDVAKNLLAIIKRRRARDILDLRSKLTAWALREEQRLLASQRKGAQARVDLIRDQVFTIDALCDGLRGIGELTERIQGFFSEGTANAVVCSSVHRAKGLEAERVFLLTDTLYLGGFKHTIEEENIHYVGLTRTKHALFLVFDPERRARKEKKA